MKASNNSLEEMYCCIIASLMADIGTLHVEWFNPRAVRCTTIMVKRRIAAEGISFLTKQMPLLGKAFDRALAGDVSFNRGRFPKRGPSSELPRFLGELFERIFTDEGWVLPSPNVECIRVVRQVLYLFYKYELPYEKDTENKVINDFVETESSMFAPDSEPLKRCGDCSDALDLGQPWLASDGVGKRPTRESWSSCSAEPQGFAMCGQVCPHWYSVMFGVFPGEGGTNPDEHPPISIYRSGHGNYGNSESARSFETVIGFHCDRRDKLRTDLSCAKGLLRRLLANFDPLEITPRHGPGAVATGERCWEKMRFSRYYPELDRVFSYADYFHVGANHLVDELHKLHGLQPVEEPSAKVCLVPKDSRGPRLISCEPLEVQWIQQGLHRALVSHIESHPLTRGVVWFTDQVPNREAARKGSLDGTLATLDLKEASDRVSLALVKELFPEHVTRALMATRSTSTKLPDGSLLKLKKFAPMGSALCFPVMALTIWALITARRIRLDRSKCTVASREILVFGDDVIVPTAHAADAIDALECAGLKVNMSKSFLCGSFRESCGLDAFSGVEVQPVRIKTLWTSFRSASAFTSWVEYGNSLYSKGYVLTGRLIADMVTQLYGPVPFRHPVEKVKGSKEHGFHNTEGDLGFPCFVFDTYASHLVKTRWNAGLQRWQRFVWVVKPKRVKREDYSGWSELLRFLTRGRGALDASTGSQSGDLEVAEKEAKRRSNLEQRLPLSMLPIDDTSGLFEAGSYTPAKLSVLSRSWR